MAGHCRILWYVAIVPTVVTRANVATRFPWVPDSRWPLPLSKPMGWKNGGKMAQKGGKMATFAGTCYVTIYDATPLLSCGCVCCRPNERREINSHNHLSIKNLRRKHGFPNFQKSRKTQHFVAYHACKVDPMAGRSRRGDRSTGHAGSRLRDKLDPQGIRRDSTPGSSRVRRAGWLGSSWQQLASPQRGSLGAGGVALRVSTPASPEL